MTTYNEVKGYKEQKDRAVVDRYTVVETLKKNQLRIHL